MPKWLPKWLKIGPKINLKAALGHLFLGFRRFGEWQKNQDFSMPLWRPKNPENRSSNGSKDAFPALAGRRGYRSWGPGSLGRPRARDSHKPKA